MKLEEIIPNKENFSRKEVFKYAEQYLSSKTRRRKPIIRLDLKKIECAVQEACGIEDIFIHSRHREIVEARHLFFYFVLNSKHRKTVTFQGLEEMTGFDHTTIIHANNKIKELLVFDKEIKRKYNLVKYLIERKERN